MLNKRFIRRQLASSRKQAVVFVLCVALSIITLVALGGFSAGVNRALQQDARQLQAADLIVRSNTPFSEPLTEAMDALAAQGRVESARLYEFISVVRVTADDNSLLSNLKVVEPGYPFYGQVELESGRALVDVLTPGNVIVGPELLERLGVQVGDPLRVGQATLTIRDVVLGEPDQPVNVFSLGPRIFIAAADLESLDLVKPGSRVRYTTLMQAANPGELNALADILQAAAEPQEQVDTYQTAESGVKRFFDNFLFFLSLIGIFTLLLAGIGIQSALTAFLKEKESTIAVVKTMGATSRFVTVHYLVVAAVLGLIGALLGLVLGLLLQSFLPLLFTDLIPPDIELTFSAPAILEGLLLGFFVVMAFTFLPVYRLKMLKPRFIFRKEEGRVRQGWPYYAAILAIFLVFVGMVLWQLRDVRVGAYFALGVVALVLVTALIAELALFALRRQRLKQLAVRQALKGLFRPRNATRAVIITLAASLAVVFTIYLIEQNLDAAFVRSYPDDAPNLFFIDIQPEQMADFTMVLGRKADYFPIVRATIESINGRPVDRRAEEERHGPDLARVFPLSYRDALLPGEALVAGNSLFDDSRDGVQVSIMDELLELRDFELGDTITFRIQGVPLEATVTSIRSRTEESFQPFFEFIFPEAALKDAPQTIFSGIRVDNRTEIPAIQNRIVAAFPNVSVIDATATIAKFAEVVRNLSQIIRFFTLFSIIAGLLIIVSSVFATRFARVQEAVYFKVLGAKGRFVLTVFTLENMLLGLLSAVLALLLSQVGSWIIITYAFELTYRPFIGASLLLVVFTVLLVTTVGLLASLSILRQKPILFLRQQSGE